MKRRSSHLIAAVVVVIASIATISVSAAHSVGLSRGAYTATPGTLATELTFARREIALAIPTIDTDRDGSVSHEELAAGHATLAATFVEGIPVRADDSTCPGSLEETGLSDQDGLWLRLRHRCNGNSSTFSIHFDLFSSLGDGHRHLATAVADTPSAPVVLHRAQSRWTVQSGVAPKPSSAEWFLLGLEHILTGYDHLVFVMGLLLAGTRMRGLLLMITAFTVAHSITLALAVTGVVAPGPRWVEPVIALSIVYVGIENWRVGDRPGRWRLTFAFGLIHGFGFAGALQEITLPQAHIPFALLTFNLGVEAGQLAVVMLVLPLLWLAARARNYRRIALPALNGAVVLAGLAWFTQRLWSLGQA
ncbi:HupE/UreJ family protein [Tahibacter amnicola]|uniref:HupE/UreJ family protein n=1 Tax=Tahibacter amnicola TaxID=2976241 RepID=A0ABY6BJL8_9GAMM|nr:HupE/UreJ family protein [Tahibacter amnicola]UXI70079.1 HupE/UreJ family protein [Tahibacter amnicola]